MVYQLASGLFETEAIDLLVILMNREKLAEELERLGVKVYIVDESKKSFIDCICVVRRLIKDFIPDIIHSHRYKENVLAWCASCGISGSKLVATQHGMPEMVGNPSITDWLRNVFFFRLLSSGFTRTVVVSMEMQRSLIGRYGFSKRDINVIHNGISVPELVIAQPRGRVVVGSAGRLFPVKDFSLLVEVARLVVWQNDTVDFVLAGDGPERTMLEKRVYQYGLGERFRFLGNQEDMVTFYRGLDLYINTSLHEGIPMSVLEAMSHGLPAVVPNAGGFFEIVEDGVSGYLVNNRDTRVFAQQILQLLDPKLRRLMGNAARVRIDAFFSRKTMTQQYYHLYQELINDS